MRDRCYRLGWPHGEEQDGEPWCAACTAGDKMPKPGEQEP